MPQVFLFRSELRQTCHPTTWRCYAAGDYFRDGGYRHGSATSQAVSRIWDMHGFQSDVHVDGSIGHITLDEGCYYGFQSHCITCIPRLESRAPKRFHPASLHTVVDQRAMRFCQYRQLRACVNQNSTDGSMALFFSAHARTSATVCTTWSTDRVQSSFFGFTAALAAALMHRLSMLYASLRHAFRAAILRPCHRTV